MIKNTDVYITKLESEFPEFKYSTNELIDLLGNKLSEDVKENIQQLGVKNRFFIKPIESYLSKNNKIKKIDDEPIAQICANVAKKLLSKLDMNPNQINYLIAASENNDYLSPGLSSVILRKIGLDNFLPHFNLQGMACSSFPKVLELGKNLLKNDNENALIVISGCNSGWYLPHLKNDMFIKNPKEISKSQYDREKQLKKWVSTMFSFLFGDGAVALIVSKKPRNDNSVKIGKITHGINFNKNDFRKACVKLSDQQENHLYEYDLTAASKVIDLALDYSKTVLMKSLGKNKNFYDQNIANSYMQQKDKVMIHTGSLKILDGFKNLYNLQNDQIKDSYNTLQNYGNLTGCSIPITMKNAFLDKKTKTPDGLLVGITMGFGLDMVEVHKNI